MQKIGLCAVIPGIFYIVVARAGNIDCVKFLRAGNQRICMKTLKETSPALVAEINGVLYYASTTPDGRRGIKVNYKGTDYSLYNRDDEEYELIHWLNGTDALVDGVWRDRLADTTSDTGPLNFVNNGCVWNDEHNGYYSTDGLAQYFATAETPTLDFGTDWYMEITAQIGEPLGTSCPIVDLASLRAVYVGKCGTGLMISNCYNKGSFPGKISTNTKPNGGDGAPANTGTAAYSWDNKTTFVVGSNRYSINQLRAFITWDGNRYYGAPYDTVRWNRWSHNFLLFRGNVASWLNDGFKNIYQCGPSTIYDVKVWRKK